MKQILLFNPPGDRLYQRDMYCSAVSKAFYYWPSIDLLVLSGILKEHYFIDVLDAIVERKSVSECLRIISHGNYEAVIFLTGTASWKKDFEILSKVSKFKNRPLLIGNGDILLSKAREFLKAYDFLDAVLFDYTSTDILDFFRRQTDKISSMAFRLNGKIEVRRSRVRLQEFAYPIPLHDKFPLERYLVPHGKRFPFTTVQTNFGCPFKCSFCVASTLGFKYRAIDNVMEELRYIVSLGIKDVFFTDFTFEAYRKNTVALCQGMISEKLDLTWVCSSRASTLDEELLALMKEAGCHTLLLGVESGEEALLRKYSKGVSKDQIRQAFSRCRSLGIRTLGHFIIGLPGETAQTVQKTIDFARELDCDIASFNIAVPALGTPLRQESLKNGWLRNDGLEFDASVSYPVLETEEFSKEQAWQWRRRAIRKFYFRPAYIWRLMISSQSLYQWKVLVLNGFAVIRNMFNGKGM